MFENKARGARDLSEGVPRVAVVLTDGKSIVDGQSATGPTIAAGAALKADGVSVYSVGLGEDVSEDELKGIASDPVDEHFFPMGANWRSLLPEYVSRMSTLTCAQPAVLEACRVVEFEVLEDDTRYFQVRMPIVTAEVVVAANDVTGASKIYISSSSQNPGPFASSWKDVSWSKAKKVAVNPADGDRANFSSATLYVQSLLPTIVQWGNHEQDAAAHTSSQHQEPHLKHHRC